MAPLDTGRYIITNSKFKNVVYLADANSYSDLCADWQQNRPGEMWNIVLLGNGNYTIKNYDYGSYASCEFIAKPDVGHSIVGGDRQHQWKIIEDDGNSYVICPTRNGQVYWHLADEESGTPITLEHYSGTDKIRWGFRQVEDAERSGVVGGDETGRVRGNDDAPSLPVLVPTPVQVPTPPVQVQGPSFESPVVELSPVQVTAPGRVLTGLPTLLISPGNYYTIGVAGTDESLVYAFSRRVEPACAALYPPKLWLITKRGDNWQIERDGKKNFIGKYLTIPDYGRGHLSDNPTELSLTPVGGPNEFRITDMDSGQSWDHLVFTDKGKSDPMAKLDGDATRRVRGNDDAPSLPVLVPTPVQVTTPDLPTLASASSLTSESLISPGNYYTIGVAGTDKGLVYAFSRRVEPACGALYPPKLWLITQRGDNWQIERDGNFIGKYLTIPEYGRGHLSDNPTELSLTPVGGPNEFRITDMDSGQSWDHLVFTDNGKSDPMAKR